MSPELRPWLLIAGMVIGYLILLTTNPVRASLLDGFRCLRRYPMLWGTLAVFGVSYALFQIGLRLMEMQILPEGERPILQWSHAWFFPQAYRLETVRSSILPAFESVAGIFNNLFTTFPVSAPAAFLLLINWQGHHVVLNRALRKRFGPRGWLIYGAISLCAVAAVIKPFVLYAGLPTLGQHFPGAALLPTLAIIDWLSFLFEYLFGVCIQIYLILLIYVWARGVNYTFAHLLDFAIRRFSSVMKWAVMVLILSSALIHLPLIASSLMPFSSLLTSPGVCDYVDNVARPLLAIFLIACATLQVTLTFHSESLRQALRDHLRFIRKNATALVWFLLVAWVNFYVFHVLNNTLLLGLGDGTAPGILWQIAAPLIQAFLGAWLLASWVCVFKRADTGRSQEENWVAF